MRPRSHGGGAGNTAAGTFAAGGVSPVAWLKKHINPKEMYGLYHLLRDMCTRYPDVLGRASNRETHALFIQLFELQVEYCFMFSLK